MRDQPAEPHTMVEERLVLLFQAGDSRAFDALVEMHLDRVFALAAELLGSREDAEEATQEVFIKLHRELSRRQAPQQLRAWLYRVCMNHCLDRRRSQRRQPVFVELTAANSGHAVDAATPALDEIWRARVRTALSALPQQQRMAFLLCHFSGLSVNEIALALNCAPATVRVHLSRAAHKLREALADEVMNDEQV